MKLLRWPIRHQSCEDECFLALIHSRLDNSLNFQPTMLTDRALDLLKEILKILESQNNKSSKNFKCVDLPIIFPYHLYCIQFCSIVLVQALGLCICHHRVPSLSASILSRFRLPKLLAPILPSRQPACFRRF